MKFTGICLITPNPDEPPSAKRLFTTKDTKGTKDTKNLSGFVFFVTLWLISLLKKQGFYLKGTNVPALVSFYTRLVEAARGIADYWGKRTIAGLLLMPATRHNIVHLNEMLQLKRRVS